MKRAHPSTVAQVAPLVAYLNSLVAQGHPEAGRTRLDADESNMLALALEQMRSRVYEDEFPELRARQILPVENDIAAGAENFAYEETSEVGEAKVITNYSDNPPSVETSSRKVTHSIVMLGDSYFYSIQDLARAAFSGRPLEARKATAARRVYERGLDAIAALGAPSDGIADGICNRAVGTGAGQLRNTAMTSAAWDTTPVAADMLNDLNKAVAEFVSDSKETHMPNVLVLPVLQYLRAAHTMFSDGSPESVLERFKKSNGFVSEVRPWDRLKSVDGSGGNYSRGLLMEQSADVVSLVIPQEFTVLAPQQHNYGFKVLGHGRTAGTCVYRPLGLRYLTAFPDA